MLLHSQQAMELPAEISGTVRTPGKAAETDTGATSWRWRRPDAAVGSCWLCAAYVKPLSHRRHEPHRLGATRTGKKAGYRSPASRHTTVRFRVCSSIANISTRKTQYSQRRHCPSDTPRCSKQLLH